MPYQCASDDGNAPVVVIQQLTDSADSVAFCGQCWPEFVREAYVALFPENEPIDLVPTTSVPEDVNDQAGYDENGNPLPIQAPPVPAPGDSENAESESSVPSAAPA